MTLRTRLLVFGAFLPSLLMGAGFVATGFLLAHHLVDATDRALLTQAAVESVSLFDSPDGRPHLHLSRSPLTGHVQGFAPDGALYDASGRPVAEFPLRELAPSRATVGPIGSPPALRTVETKGRRVRELRVVVASPSGERYLLWLGIDLATTDRTLLFFAQAAGVVLLAGTLLFFALQRREAASLHERLEHLVSHMDRLREGRFDAPPADTGHDVVATLRDAVAEATERLRIAHDTETRLVADAAHELRTPLTAMRAVIDTTLRRERSADELREALVHARAEVDRLAALATDLLDLASVQQTSFARERVDVREIVDAAAAGLEPLAKERGIELEVRIAENVHEVRAVGSQVRRAIENLLFNALKFAPRASMVRLEVAEVKGRVRISVTDHGEGVPEDEREAIFEPFRRGGRSSGRGTGLGLAIVRDIARRHGGEAWVDRVAPKGACFAFEIAPMARGEERA